MGIVNERRCSDYQNWVVRRDHLGNTTGNPIASPVLSIPVVFPVALASLFNSTSTGSRSLPTAKSVSERQGVYLSTPWHDQERVSHTRSTAS